MTLAVFPSIVLLYVLRCVLGSPVINMSATTVSVTSFSSSTFSEQIVLSTSSLVTTRAIRRSSGQSAPEHDHNQNDPFAPPPERPPPTSVSQSANVTSAISSSTVASAESTTINSSSSDLPSSVLAATSQFTPAQSTAFSISGRSILVLPIGLGILGGLMLIAILAVAIVTIQRVRHRREFRRKLMLERITPYILPDSTSHPTLVNVPTEENSEGKNELRTSIVSSRRVSRGSSYWPSDSSWPSAADSEPALTAKASTASIITIKRPTENTEALNDDYSISLSYMSTESMYSQVSETSKMLK